MEKIIIKSEVMVLDRKTDRKIERHIARWIN